MTCPGDRGADAADFAGSGDLVASRADVPTRFRRHADAMARAGRSPLTVALMRGAADDIDAGGIVAELVAGIPLPPGHAPALRLMAALHRLVLEGRAPALGRYYPSAGGAEPPDAVWPVARDALVTHAPDVRPLLFRGVQTNEPGRSAVLYGVLLWVRHRYALPVHLSEIGASAGLNLLAPDFAYRVGDSLLGDARSPLVFEDPWVGVPVPDAPGMSDALVVASRRGCDPAPIDAAGASGRLTLQSYIWPDETARMDRLRAALAVAARHRPVVDPEAAGPWLARMFAVPHPGAVHVVWQSVMAQYLTPGARAELAGDIEAAGASAVDASPLVWARLEPGDDYVAGFDVRVRCWPGGVDTLLAHAGDHGPPVRWVGTPPGHGEALQ